MPLEIKFYSKEELQDQYENEYYATHKGGDPTDYISWQIKDNYNKVGIGKIDTLDDLKIGYASLYVKKGDWGKMIVYELK